jgi:hypothetical protein
MAFDFTCLATFQANSSARHSSSVGARFVFTTAARAVQRGAVGGLRQESAGDRFHHQAVQPGADFHQPQVLFAASTASASGA